MGAFDGLLDTVQNGIEGTLDNISDAASDVSVGEAALGAGATGLALGVGGTLSAQAIKKRVSRKKRSSSSRSRKSSSRGRRKYKHRNYKYARTAGRRRDTSRKRIRMTKTGQPYVILANGRARFIKRSSAKRSRRMKGGRY